MPKCGIIRRHLFVFVDLFFFKKIVSTRALHTFKVQTGGETDGAKLHATFLLSPRRRLLYLFMWTFRKLVIRQHYLISNRPCNGRALIYIFNPLMSRAPTTW